jgi:hypothetical protein
MALPHAAPGEIVDVRPLGSALANRVHHVVRPLPQIRESHQNLGSLSQSGQTCPAETKIPCSTKHDSR